MEIEGVSPIVSVFLLFMSGVVTPILIFLLNKNISENQRKEEHWRNLQLELHSSRLEVYRDILEPYSVMFAKEEGIAYLEKYKQFRNANSNCKTPLTISRWDLARLIIASPEYNQTIFRLSLLGNDQVVKAYNRLLNKARCLVAKKLDEKSKPITLGYLAEFLLELRKNLINKNTELKSAEMLVWLNVNIKELESTTSDQQQVAENSTT